LKELADAALKKAKVDSIARLKVSSEKKQMADSITQLKSQLEKMSKELQEAKSKAKSDSVASAEEARALKDKVAKEAALSKEKKNQELRNAVAENARKKAIEDSIMRIKTESVTAMPSNSVPNSQPINRKPNIVTYKAADTIPNSNMPVILFDKNRADFSQAAEEELKAIGRLMIANPDSRLVLFSLASFDESGQRPLSRKRSEQVLLYLNQVGIPVSRIKATYYGDSISLNGCNKPNCPQEMMQKNRCVAYQVIVK